MKLLPTILFLLFYLPVFSHSPIHCPCVLHFHRSRRHPPAAFSLLLRLTPNSSVHPLSINLTFPQVPSHPQLHVLTHRIPQNITLYPELISPHPLTLRSVSVHQDTPTCPPRLKVTTRQPTPRIVGGNLITPALIPYLVAIINPDGQYCTGTMLTPVWGITAAHCRLSTNFRVELLSTIVRADRAPSDGVSSNLSRVISHHNYAGTGPGRQNDLSLFRLTAPVPGVLTMRVNTAPLRPRAGEYVRVMGFGYTSYQQTSIEASPGALRQVDVPIVEHSVCKDVYDAWETVSNTKQVCAGYFGVGGCDAWYVTPFYDI